MNTVGNMSTIPFFKYDFHVEFLMLHIVLKLSSLFAYKEYKLLIVIFCALPVEINKNKSNLSLKKITLASSVELLLYQ